MLTVRSFVKKAASPSSPSKTKKVHFEAFLLPLQVWAYECIPKLESLGLCTVFKDDARPLILRWSSSSRVSESALHYYLLPIRHSHSFSFDPSVIYVTKTNEIWPCDCHKLEKRVY